MKLINKSLKKISYSVILCSLFSSCNEQVSKKNQIKKEVHYPIGKSYQDSSLFYDYSKNNYRINYYNNNVINESRYQSPAKIEYVYVPDSLGNIVKDIKRYEPHEMIEIRDYKTINGELYLNQIKYLNKEKKVIMGIGNYFMLYLLNGDTISVKDAIQVGINLLGMYREFDSSAMVIIPKFDYENYNTDFSNENNIEVDTIFNLNIELTYRKQLGIPDGEDYRNELAFGRYFDMVGENNFRGILVEYYNEKVAPDSLVRREHKYYFDIPVFVKDTLN